MVMDWNARFWKTQRSLWFCCWSHGLGGKIMHLAQKIVFDIRSKVTKTSWWKRICDFVTEIMIWREKTRTLHKKVFLLTRVRSQKHWLDGKEFVILSLKSYFSRQKQASCTKNWFCQQKYGHKNISLIYFRKQLNVHTRK